MPAWLLIAVIAYLFMALSQAVDKALLNVVFRNSRAYAALVGCLGLLTFVLLPWSRGGLTPVLFLLSLVAGALFLFALVPFLSSLQGDQASRIIPLVGAAVPLFTCLLEYATIGLILDRLQLLGLLLLVVGAVLLTMSKATSRRSWSAVGKAVLAAFLFAACFVVSRYVYQQADFLAAFVWMRLGGFFVALWLLSSLAVRREISRLWQHQRMTLVAGYAGNQVLAGIGFALQNYAISLGTATLVTAVQGVQYAVLVLLVLVASRIRPQLLQETITPRVAFEKFTAIIVVAAGLYLLAL